ncbi:hypothetical protein [Roseicitreum antarcticum]|uniref:Uncharacterized protein n=1 Tax=Roseicitreum antarcticum TaxID=564137 RepID=A0A1H2ZVP4_9RHOB|nr:hypothetical protein [Roseicitreum antarcticum]SDX21377.1 hypothetical protein SAMN04488238_10690 [Roseicitreum antarcticum]
MSVEHKSNPVAEPVTRWENDQCQGLALCVEPLFRGTVAHAEVLRARQKAYLDSLPTDPQEAIRAALKLMSDNGKKHPAGVQEALHLSYALGAMVSEGYLEGSEQSRDAALYVAYQLSDALCRATRQLDRIADILSNQTDSARH